MTLQRSHARSWTSTGLVVAGAIAALVLRAPAARAPFWLDDFAHQAMLEGDYPVRRNPLDLFSFARDTADERAALMSRGLLPWWTSPNFRLAMFRPLSSALIWLDHAAFGRRPLGPHVHSLVWLLLAFAAARAWLGRVLSPGVTTTAIVLLAVDESFTVPVAWLANRSSLVATCFGALAVAAYVRSRTREPSHERALPIAATLLAIAAGEYAYSVLVAIPLYELVVATDPWRVRARRIAPIVAVVVAMLGIARLLGYGARSSSAYVDPFTSPAALLRAVLERGPTLVAHLFAGRPIEGATGAWLGLARAPRAAIAALAVVGLAVGAATARSDAGERRRVLWLMLTALAGIVPVCAVAPSERLLVGPAIAASGAFAVALRPLATLMHERVRPRGWAWLGVPTAALIGLVHGPVAAYRSWVGGVVVAQIFTASTSALRSARVDARGLGGASIVLAGAADPQTLHFPTVLWRLDGRPLARAWRVIAMNGGILVAHRTSADTIEFGSNVPLFSSPVAQLFRAPGDEMLRASEVDLPDMNITALDETPLGPTHIRVQFRAPLDDVAVRFYVTLRDTLMQLPAPPIAGGGVLPPSVVPLRR